LDEWTTGFVVQRPGVVAAFGDAIGHATQTDARNF
jgi:hypothetical protein